MLSSQPPPRCHVHFNNECIVIPDYPVPAKRGFLRPHRFLAKSITLPLLFSSDSASGSTEEDRGRKLNIGFYKFGSPSRKERSSVSVSAARYEHGHDTKYHPGHRLRSRSLPVPANTVPLRDCCKACIPVVDAFYASPSVTEHMSEGARRIQREGTGSGTLVEKVKVDEIDIIRSSVLTSDDGAFEPDGMKPLQLVLDEDEAQDHDDDSVLFPLPSPRNSPLSSPSASQSSLASPVAVSPSGRLPKGSPLVACMRGDLDEDNEDTPDFCRSMNEKTATNFGFNRTRSASTSSDTMSAKTSTRRPSLSSLGETFSRGGAAMLRGLASVASSQAVH